MNLSQITVKHRSLIHKNVRTIFYGCSLCNPRQVKFESSIPKEYSLNKNEETPNFENISQPQKVPSHPIVQKYSDLLHDFRLKFDNDESSEYVYKTPFGHVRFDHENISLKYKQSQLSNTLRDDDIKNNSCSTPNNKDVGYFDELYFGNALNNQSKSVECNDKEPTTVASLKNEELNYIDNNYFGNNSNLEAKLLSSSDSVTKDTINNDNSLNFIDQTYFKDSRDPLEEVCRTEDLIAEFESSKSDFEKALFDIPSDTSQKVCDPRYNLGAHTEKLESEFKESFKEKLAKLNAKKLPKEKAIISEDQILGSTTVVNANEEKANFTKDIPPDSALAYALKLRRSIKTEKLTEDQVNSNGDIPRYKRIIESLPNYYNMPKMELELMLKESIIYNKDDLVAINKPFGMRVHDGGKSRDVVLTLTDMLPVFCDLLNTQKLHMVHRLDVSTTGVLLMAKSEDVASKLREMFKNNSVIKTYLAIVRGTPQILQGIIDIPLREGETDGKMRMMLHPVLPDDPKKGRKKFGTRAVTKYKVLSKSFDSSLLSVNPLTGVKHQIRAHLGLGLRCPIIADHKYSHEKKIVPQKLPQSLLDRLEIRQSRVRDLPIMLHSSSVFFPQFLGKDEHLKIKCLPPVHFRIALKALKLKSSRRLTDIDTIESVDLAAESV